MAGISSIKVRRRPRVAVISIGDQIALPVAKLRPGQHYAGNLIATAAWLASFGIACETSVVADNEDAILQEMQKHSRNVDAVLTIGGTLDTRRRFVIAALNKLGWQELFNQVRMEPGEKIVFGVWENLPVFCLPGDPAGNRMAFLQLALPALLRMSGETRHPLQTVPARLTEEVKGRYNNWTDFKDASISLDAGGCYTAALYKNRSSLQTIAGAGGLICIPEGKETLRSGEVVPVQLLASRLDDL
jgi:molybdopterin molybdotransferase